MLLERRFFLKMLTSSVAASLLPTATSTYGSQVASSSTVLPIQLDLTGPGRLGFYVDYSERDTLGVHTFYVTRTHGSKGNVGCEWTAYNSLDGSTIAAGTLHWSDGAIDIKSFTVNIESKVSGEHRIYVLLSNAKGGAELHHAHQTVAYGIIDDNTIADKNAIFIDVDAQTNGNGSRTNPFNNWYSARDSVKLSTRFIYIKGFMVPNETDTVGRASTKYFDVGDTFAGRVAESQRLIIREWPGFTGGIDGGGQKDTTGFFCNGNNLTDSVQFITFRKLTCINLNNSSGNNSGYSCYFLRTKSSSDNKVGNITGEIIKIDGVVSGANAAIAVWFSEDCSNLKLWRWNVANTSHVGRDWELNTFECYRTDNVSIQRCTIHRTAGGVFQKEGFVSETKVGMSLRFNHFKGNQVRFSTQGGRAAQDYSIVQNNIFDEVHRTHNFTSLRFDMNLTDSNTTSHIISNNIFYKYDFSTYSDITIESKGFKGVIVFNNIHLETKRPFTFYEGVSPAEYIDYNHYEYIDSAQPVFKYLSNEDVTMRVIQASTFLLKNTTTGNPLLDESTWRISSASPCFATGLYRTNKGVYLIGNEMIGASNLSMSSPPEKMKSPSITVLD